jgi:hypothetical protein
VNRESPSVALFPALRWFSQASLVVLAAALPFELVRPVAPLGPLKLSSVELFLYATVGSWLASRSAAAWVQRGTMRDWPHPRRLWRNLSRTHRAAALWAMVLLVSALAAPMGRAPAIKFALRSLGGVLLFVAAADLLDSPGAIRRTLIALGVGALIAALLMALELSIAGQFALLLRPFHAQTFGILGLMRASGPFQYPNIGAMYLEASLPVLVATGATVTVGGAGTGPRLAPRALALTALAGLVVIYAIVLAASRAGLITTLLALFGLAALARDQPALRRLSIGLAAGMVVVTLVAQSLSPLLALRLRVWQEGSWYASVIEPTPERDEPPSPLPVGGQIQVPLSIRNIGALTWPAGGSKPVKLSYHWMNEDGDRVVQLDGARTDLPHDIVAGERFDIEANLKTPARPGNYSLWWDLVHERVTWFSDTADLGLWQSMVVGVPEAPRTGKARTTRTVLTRNTFDEFSRIALWRAGWLAFRDHPVLGIGPDNFRHAYGTYLGRLGADERLHANNFYIEILATMGVFGVLALGTLMIALARTARRAARGPTRVLTFGVAVGLAAYFVHGTLDYFLGFTPTYALFWLLAGTLAALERIAARATDARRTSPLSPVGWSP